MKPRCKRSSGTERAFFDTREQAIVFSKDPANQAYHGDVPVLCDKCDLWHLTPPAFLEPELTHRDYELLSSMGIEVPNRVPGGMKCARCGVVFREDVNFLILRDGSTVCETGCVGKSS